MPPLFLMLFLVTQMLLLGTYAAGGVGTGFIIRAAVPEMHRLRNAVLAPWHDIHPGLGGTIQYTNTGTAPNRVFTVSWENVPMFSCGTASPAIYHSSQVRLFETSNAIEIHVRNKGVCQHLVMVKPF